MSFRCRRCGQDQAGLDLLDLFDRKVIVPLLAAKATCGLDSISEF
ncbi:MAG: hypothetical protein WCF85_06725 [Rhodospirillaceae bacterium]